MPRSSGTYTVPNTFTPNTTMSASAVNQNFTDAGNEITNSIARDGQSAMTGQFKAIAGSAPAPGMAFGIDLDTGFYLAAAGDMRWAAGGSDRMYFTTAGVAVLPVPVSITGDLELNGPITGAGMADLTAIEALTGTGALTRTGSDTWALDPITTNLTITKDGFGDVLDTGIIGDLVVPFACTITKATLLADQSGSVVVDIWKDTLANFPPTNADSITAAAPPTISTATKSEDATLTGWDVDIAAGEILRFNIDSITSITRLTISLTVERF